MREVHPDVFRVGDGQERVNGFRAESRAPARADDVANVLGLVQHALIGAHHERNDVGKVDDGSQQAQPFAFEAFFDGAGDGARPVALAVVDDACDIGEARKVAQHAPACDTSTALRSTSVTDWGSSTTMDPMSCNSAAYIVMMTSSSGRPISRARNSERYAVCSWCRSTSGFTRFMARASPFMSERMLVK